MSVNGQLDEDDLSYLNRLFRDPRAAFDASNDDAAALDFLDSVRWPSGVFCPKCSARDTYFQAKRSGASRRWRRCRECAHQFSPTSGTPLDSERVSPSELALCVSVATQFTGMELSTRIEDASGLSRLRASRMALLLQDLYEKQLAVEGADGSDSSQLRAAAALPDGLIEKRARELGYRRQRTWIRRLQICAGSLAATLIAAMTVAWAAGAFDQVVHADWLEGDRRHIISTPRGLGEGFLDWRLRHQERVATFKRMLAATNETTQSLTKDEQ